MLRLSFILPCYNVAPYFGRCIESIEHQDIPQSEYEVICVDDCSKDNTVEVIKEYQKQYPNIRLICHTENKTAGGARNTAIEAAEGEYIWCVDPDDSIQSCVLGSILKKAEEQNLDILLFNLSYTDENGGNAERIFHNTQYDVYTGVDYTITHCAPRYLYNVASHTGCIYNRLFLDSNHIRYPEIRSSQDVAFIWHAILLSKRVSALKNVCYNVYRRPNSTTGSKGELRAVSVVSTVLLYVDVINQYRGISNNELIEENILYDMRSTVNDDSRKVIRMSRYQQSLFYKEIGQHTDLINRYRFLMNRKTQVILNYHLPYAVWQLIIWAYMLKNSIKK